MPYEEVDLNPSHLEILQSIQDEVGYHEYLNSVIDLFRPHIYRWHDLSLLEKSELMTTAGWAVLFRYLTNDKSIDYIVTNKIEHSRQRSPRFEPCTEITDEMLFTDGTVDYFFIGREIHKRNCWINDWHNPGCRCFGLVTPTTSESGLC